MCLKKIKIVYSMLKSEGWNNGKYDSLLEARIIPLNKCYPKIGQV